MKLTLMQKDFLWMLIKDIIASKRDVKEIYELLYDYCNDESYVKEFLEDIEIYKIINLEVWKEIKKLYC